MTQKPIKSPRTALASITPISACIINHFFFSKFLFFLWGMGGSKPNKKENCAISVKCAKLAINMLRSDTSIKNALERRSFPVLSLAVGKRIRYGFIGSLTFGLAFAFCVFFVCGIFSFLGSSCKLTLCRCLCIEIVFWGFPSRLFFFTFSPLVITGKIFWRPKFWRSVFQTKDPNKLNIQQERESPAQGQINPRTNQKA